MAHGIKPYGRTAEMNTVYGLQDLGELAARLKSIDTFDRRGNVIWMSDMEDGMSPLERYGNPAAAVSVWSQDQARSGSFSIRCTTAAVAGSYAGIRKYLPYSVVGQLSLEISFTVPDVNAYHYFFFSLSAQGRDVTPQLQYIRQTQNFQLMDELFAWHDFAAPLVLREQVNMFHTVKLVCDFVEGRYMRIIVDGTEYNVSQFLCPNVPGGVQPFLMFNARYHTNVNVALTTYYDDVILKQNEP